MEDLVNATRLMYSQIHWLSGGKTKKRAENSYGCDAENVPRDFFMPREYCTLLVRSQTPANRTPPNRQASETPSSRMTRTARATTTTPPEPPGSHLKKVLLITYEFAPSVSIGALRPGGLAKYLPEFGWAPVVLTPRKPSNGARSSARVVETDYRDVLAEWKARLRLNRTATLHEQLGLEFSSVAQRPKLHTKLIQWITQLIAYPDAKKGWRPFAVRATRGLASEHFDAIISTGPPFTCHLIGAAAKRLLHCPWVADLRDLWDCSGFRKRLERRTLRHADALVAVSEPAAQTLTGEYPGLRTACILNGYDPDEVPHTPPPLTEKFTITYTGQLYEGKRDPAELFSVVRELMDEGKIDGQDLRLRFYGCADAFLRASAERLGLRSQVEIYPTVTHEEALRRQRESQLLLLLCWSNLIDSAAFTIPGKLFEYLAARRPVISVGVEKGGVAEILQTTGAGRHAASRAGLRDLLLSHYAEFRRLGYTPDRQNRDAMQAFSQRNMARKMAELLSGITASPAAALKENRGRAGSLPRSSP